MWRKVYTGVLAVGVLFFAWVIMQRFSAAKKSYYGTVVDKRRVVTIRTLKSMYKNTRAHYILKVKTEEGEIITVTVPLWFYERVKIGDTIRKEKGEKYPEIVKEGQ